MSHAVSADDEKPDRRAEILRLRESGLTMAAIGKVLGISKQSVQGHILRAELEERREKR